MVIHTYGHSRTFEAEALLKLFRPAEKFAFSQEQALPDGEYLSAVIQPQADGQARLLCGVKIGEKCLQNETIIPADTDSHTLEHEICTLLFPLLVELTGIRPEWGLLTGIRPVTLLKKYAAKCGSIEAAERVFAEKYLVTPEKIRLAREILDIQQPIFAQTPEKSVGVYLSVPFCPTRCRYCSFVSNSVSRMRGLIPDYYKCIHRETEMTGQIMDEFGLTADSIYIGGGTPTSIDLYQPLDWLNRYIPAAKEGLREFTAEAGRPDTVTRENLAVMRQLGVTRISVNPQSFQDHVLRAAGRPHTAQDAADKFFLAREAGFDNINMDFIAGLPADTVQGFRESIDRAVSMEPESITVHCLALKKAADFYQELALPDAQAVSEMVAYAQETLHAAGYRPYYLYRQKNMAGNLENVGYAKPGCESVYNVLMMDDSQTILGIGAGASTKILGGPHGIERLTECKYPNDYLARFDALMEAKSAQMRDLLR